MRRPVAARVGLAALTTALALTAAPARATHSLLYGSVFCDRSATTRGSPITVDGPSSQVTVHTDVFAPAYAEACPSGAGMVTYLGTGDRAGVDAIIDHVATRHFGTSDLALTTVEKAQAELDFRARDQRGRRSGLHHIPLYIEAQAVGYNLPAACGSLNLRGQVLGLIYSGRVTRWNHDTLRMDNPGLAACNLPVRLVKRVDFAGSTAIFKDYLSKRDPSWNLYEQPERNQDWPSLGSACPALGDEGVADCILSLEGAIGYLPLHTARLRGVRVAPVDNAASALDGNPARRFIAPSAAACQTAATAAVTAPTVPPVSLGGGSEPTNGFPGTRSDWSVISITDAPAGYPICGIAYALMFDRLQAAYGGSTYPFGAARTSVDYLWTALGAAAQGRLAAFDYAPLPRTLLDTARAGVEAIRYTEF